MSVRTTQEIIDIIKSRIGDDTSDEALSILEDVSDTLKDYENRANPDGKDWKAEYDKLDNEWRVRYRDRFSSSGDETTPETTTEEEGTTTILSFEKLFKEE